MAKRDDPTMEMSTSQLVPDQPRGDASVWRQTVVSTDDFLPAASRDRRPLWLLLGVVAVAAVAAAVIALA